MTPCPDTRSEGGGEWLSRPARYRYSARQSWKTRVPLCLLLQPAYVLQIFPPCEFSESHLSRLAPDLLASISNISPHLMIVIASV